MADAERMSVVCTHAGDVRQYRQKRPGREVGLRTIHSEGDSHARNPDHECKCRCSDVFALPELHFQGHKFGMDHDFSKSFESSGMPDLPIHIIQHTSIKSIVP